jgi:ElaB/YqjD/DUF883 family membrane-anchored ribosome-binding protein
MSNDPSPLKYMGTQSQETVNMAAAIARAAAGSTERAADHAMETLPDKVDDASGGVAAVGSKISDAASWAVGEAKDTIRSAGERASDRSTTAVTSRTKEDPIRAILIAAGAGALLMGLVVMMARSGVRTVKRAVQR